MTALTPNHPLKILSLGAGVQSTCLALMAHHGEIEKPDYAIFADTQWEPRAVYDTLARIESLVSYPVYRVSAGDLWASATKLRRTIDRQRTYIKTSVPVFTKMGLRVGKAKRLCTIDFKIRPITKEIRRLLGFKRVPANSGILAEVWIGISLDESSRMKPNKENWLKNRWPLVEMRMTRTDCLEWLKSNGYPEPMRSACIFCPYREDESWRLLNDREINDVYLKEDELQGAYRISTELKATPYFHKSLKPLAQVNFQKNNDQINMFINECEGICGV